MNLFPINGRGCHGSDRMVVGFKTTHAISAYHHWCCEFDTWSGRGVQHYVIKFISDLRQVGGFLRVLRFPPPIKLTIKTNQPTNKWYLLFSSPDREVLPSLGVHRHPCFIVGKLLHLNLLFWNHRTNWNVTF